MNKKMKETIQKMYTNIKEFFYNIFNNIIFSSLFISNDILLLFLTSYNFIYNT